MKARVARAIMMPKIIWKAWATSGSLNVEEHTLSIAS